MTSRRAIKHWDQKVSRALQFVPGHVGGRVASAQPVAYRVGTVLNGSLGEMGAASGGWTGPLPLPGDYDDAVVVVWDDSATMYDGSGT